VYEEKTYIKGPLDNGTAGQIRSTLELVVVALPERLRSIRNIAIVAEDRQPGAHPQCRVLSNPLGQYFTIVIIRILRRHILQENRVVHHGLHALANGVLAIGNDCPAFVPHYRIADCRDVKNISFFRVL